MLSTKLQLDLEVGVLCNSKDVMTHLPEDAAFLFQLTQCTPDSQHTDPRDDITGYLPGVASRLSMLPLSLGASQSYGPPTVRYSPGHSNHQQTKDPDNKNNRYERIHLHPARRELVSNWALIETISREGNLLAGYLPSLSGAARDTLSVELSCLWPAEQLAVQECHRG